MLHHLTRYLLQYKQVCIPHAGTFQLVQQPPYLNVPDKLLEPPAYSFEWTPKENPSVHQLIFLQRSMQQETSIVQNQLQSFGLLFKQKLQNGGFVWEGLSTVTNEGQGLPVSLPCLQAVPAEKVIRQDALHTVLVGDKELTSAQVLEKNAAAPFDNPNRRVAVVIGWIVLFLSLIAICVLLYLGNFNVAASGSKLSPAG